MFQRILVTLDGSAYGERVLDYVPDLARIAGAHVTLLTVLPEEPTPLGSSGREASEERMTPFRTYMSGIADRLAAEGLEEVQVELRSGSPARTIVQTARELQADLIAMSTQGLGAEQEQGLGGVAAKVLASASCPVFMVRISRPLPPQTSAEQRWQSEGGANVG